MGSLARAPHAYRKRLNFSDQAIAGTFDISIWWLIDYIDSAQAL
jgi:hypothetical protein